MKKIIAILSTTHDGYIEDEEDTTPDKPLHFSGALATVGEKAYAEFAYATPHSIVSLHYALIFPPKP